MSTSAKQAAKLLRMQAARRQTQHQLDVIDRQITRKMTALIPLIGRRHQGYRRGKAQPLDAFLERYRANLEVLTAERQPEVDALTRKLARQDAAIAGLPTRQGPSLGPASVGAGPGG
ncbi:hypothetical protein OE766_26705 [Pararhizobium sp. YC-54]|uniref:hypothetical protein n=1 Tax=Pararhizobium sp. YC-54 TaxID=2986920 RepID=UPI0021F6A499|nr:hypothetical protein [Pararhizobium sp. YC-54]MCW0001810.1 hypothetical protein [Pararhizobium sp. YC-54]